MDEATVDQFCSEFAATSREYPFDEHTVVWKVSGKMFALWREGREPFSMNLKCDPDVAMTLRDSYAAIEPGYHMSKRHWNTITLDGSVPDSMLREMIEDSYDLVVDTLPKKVRKQLRPDG